MELNSAIFPRGTHTVVDRNHWASRLFAVMAIAQTMRIEPGRRVVYACDPTSLDSVRSQLDDTLELLPGMIGSLGLAIAALAKEDAEAAAHVGWVVAGLSEMHGDILHAAAWMRSDQGFVAVGDPFSIAPRVADSGDSCESGSQAFRDLMAQVVGRNPVDAETMRNPLHVDLATAFRSTLQHGPAHVEGFFRELGAILHNVADGCSIEGYAKGIDYSDPVQAKLQQDIDDRWTKLEEAGVPFDTTLALPAWALSLATSRPASKTSKALSPPASVPMNEEIRWNDLPRAKARADLTACIESSTSAVHAGARLARSMLRAMEPVQGGETTGPGDNDCAPFAYDAMGIEIQKYMAAAAFDSQCPDFMDGFTMALAVYLYPGLTGSTLARNLLVWDPVEALEDAGFCLREPPAPTAAATSPSRNRRKPATARKAVATASAPGSRPPPLAETAAPRLKRSGAAGPQTA